MVDGALTAAAGVKTVSFDSLVKVARELELPMVCNPLVFTLSVGPSWTQAGATQTFYLRPEILNSYVTNKNTSTLASGELFGGWQYSINTHVLVEIGLTIGAASNAKLTGNIWEDANVTFDDYTYSYNVDHAYVALKGKLLAEPSI